MQSTFSITEQNTLLSAWVHGWTISRGTPPAVALAEDGFHIPVGLPGHLERYVIYGQAISAIRSLARELSAADTWLKICAPVTDVAALLPARWQIRPAEYLMHKAIRASQALILPERYNMRITEDGQAVTAHVLSTDGQIAATGRMALTSHFAVFDQVVTDPAHRRKGLGQQIMQALSNYAFGKQANTGVLVATEDGKALYSAIGWALVSAMTAAVICS